MFGFVARGILSDLILLMLAARETLIDVSTLRLAFALLLSKYEYVYPT